MSLSHISSSGREQTNQEHNENTAKLCEEYAATIGLQYVGRIAGLLHDLGKLKQVFEAYLRYSYQHPEDKNRRGTVNHASAGARYIMERYWSNVDKFRALTAQLISLSIAGHHGYIPDIINLDGTDCFDKRLKPDKEVHYEESVTNFLAECCSAEQLDADFENARDEVAALYAHFSGYNKQQGFFALHLLAKYLYSCLIDADRYDTYLFMCDKKEEAPANTHALWTELSQNLERYLAGLGNTSPIGVLRKECSEACLHFAKQGKGIYRLALPTGAGKTLASLRFALNHAKEHDDIERIFYIIPYTTIIDQTSDCFKKALQRKDVILEHHSNLILEDKIRQTLIDKGFLPKDTAKLMEEELERYELLTERYDSPIILTTAVQFFNAFFGGSQSMRRMHRFAKSVIIFDEVQTVPVKCIALFNSVCNFLADACGSTIVLCTATQPLLDKVRIPLKLPQKPDMVERPADIHKSFKRVNVQDCHIAGGYDTEALSDFVMDKLEKNRSLLTILNTKREAASLYSALTKLNKHLPAEEQFFLCHLSTSMCPAHRRAIIDELVKSLGDPKFNKRIVCISTQLIEAGIDISFECVVRALAGLDSIAQAAGRCNRNKTKDIGMVYIVNIAGENLSKLPDIKLGAEHCERVLGMYKDQPEVFDDDLLSPKAIEEYFKGYLKELEKDNKTAYPVKNLNVNLYDLLSDNPHAVEAYIGRNKRNSNLILRQAFSTAAENFEVIDSDTVSVLVPYEKEGKELITTLNGRSSLDQQRDALKRAQQYSVNLFRHQFDYLTKQKDAIKPLLNGGVLALNEAHYSETLGVVAEPEMMAFLATDNLKER